MRRAPLVAALFAASCGASPTVPSSNPPQPTGPPASGSYSLTVMMATTGSGTSACVGIPVGGAPILGVAVTTPLSNGSATTTGIVGPTFVSGILNGTISVGDMSCTNNGHTWTLGPALGAPNLP